MAGGGDGGRELVRPLKRREVASAPASPGTLADLPDRSAAPLPD
jgi:hypothetical protein